MRLSRSIGSALALIAALLVLAPTADAAPRLRAGVGTADITPPTGFPLGGWTRADRISAGVHTRLAANVVVLERGDEKMALVSVDLFAAPGGLVEEAAERAGHGFSAENVVVSASHTHAGPGGFANFPTLNTVAPSPETIDDPTSFAELINPQPADPKLYTFLVKRLATALRRADRDVGPAAAAWGVTRLSGVTQNRSLEAHLADHGVIEEYDQGEVSQDPEGYAHTIDPTVSMLRVDRVRPGGRSVPIGGWSVFANHGTVNPSEFTVYNQDHHGTARRVLVERIRRAGDVPAGREVVDVFGNSNEGDQSAGLVRQGPSHAEAVGTKEGAAMFRAWREAGRGLSRRAEVGLRWTRVCFCGQMTADGRVADSPLPGTPFLTGSEEGRGPLYDLTGVPFEGQRSPVEGFESQGHKVGIPITSEDSYPTAVPLFVVRVADRLIISLPGEPTVEVGRRARRAVMAEYAGSGVKGAVVSGLTNEFIQYITTPEEYDRQHYEGGSTIFGPAESAAMIEPLAGLAESLRRGEPARPPDAFDPKNGVEADAKPYPRGRARGRSLTQPPDVRPGAQAVFVWRGGARGFDRPLDDPFITIKRFTRDGRVRVADDLGVEIVWTVNDDREYEMHWQVPSDARGRYRVVVTANRYKLGSKPFRVRPGAPGTAGDPDHPAAVFAPVTRTGR